MTMQNFDRGHSLVLGAAVGTASLVGAVLAVVALINAVEAWPSIAFIGCAAFGWLMIDTTLRPISSGDRDGVLQLD